jgi:hypothetical protein
MEEKTYWGYHLRLEGVGSPLELITSRRTYITSPSELLMTLIW